MKSLSVLSVNTSSKKGQPKKPTQTIQIDSNGVVGDAHRGYWHRQVSLLSWESIRQFSKTSKKTFQFGDFAENITTKGFPVYKTKVLDRFISQNVELVVSQIGKKCHGDGCSIFNAVGKCVMPKEGIFCKVAGGGTLQKGDILQYIPKVFRIQIITLSDRASADIYKDISGEIIKENVQNYFQKIDRECQIEKTVIPDDKTKLNSIISKSKADVIFTSGGTGVGPRDFTPEVVKDLLKFEIPGIMEAIRVKYGAIFPNALLSRGVAGVLQTGGIIYTLPGSTKAAGEYCEQIFKTLYHTILMLHGIDAH